MKDGTCKQLIDLMKVSEIDGQGHFFTLVQGHLQLNIKTGFSHIPLVFFNQILYVSFQVQENENLLI